MPESADTTGSFGASLAATSDEVPFGEVIVPVGGPVSALRAVAHGEHLAQAMSVPVRYVDVDDDSAHAEEIRLRTSAANPHIPREAIQVLAGSDPVVALAGRIHSDSLLCMATDHAGDTDRHRSVAVELLRNTGSTAVLVGPYAQREIGQAPIAVSIEGKQVLPEGAVDELSSRRQQRKTG